ncbi:aminopeptidase [Coemansia sp. RSA 1807]|nr:aminopeptidase [Coemansia sp. RSA 1591]KAJ1757349.1 aminopeptidase [Coemansia sp. RSA 1752]KAJ2274495.1 aminopeptidase [Coemansia sp. RSA 451]KAJ2572908.1 aminopeptidase [Coemansia sp. RSA 1807]
MANRAAVFVHRLSGHSLSVRRLSIYGSRLTLHARRLHASSAGRSFLSTLLQTAKTKNPITAQWNGQPTHETHPELVAQGETTPGILQSEYDQRRRNIVDSLPDGGTAFLFSAPMHFVSPHVFHEFRQDSDFYYMTGWNEPESVAVLQKSATARRGYTLTMFVRAKEPEKELWEGPRSGLETAVAAFGADEAWPIRDFAKRAAKLIGGAHPVYADLDGEHGLVRSEQCGELRQILQRSNAGARVRRLTPIVQRARLIKSTAELQLMREAGRVSGAAFAAAMRACGPGVSESTLQSMFAHASKMALLAPITDRSTLTTDHSAPITDRSALTRPAYVPVFAGGEHALCMHYVLNNAPLRAGDLVLADAGAEVAAYAADVTRTFPVSGRFSEQQRDLYCAVLSVQEQMVRLCHADAGYPLNEIHRCSTHALATELRQIGFHAAERDIERQLYPHHVAHYLGLDVHDTIDMSRALPLRPGMVVTIEPGLYVPYDDRFPKAFQGIGVRIEDDIAVGQTEADIENLSASAPKSPADIEACMAR